METKKTWSVPVIQELDSKESESGVAAVSEAGNPGIGSLS